MYHGMGWLHGQGWMSWERFRCEIDCHSHPDTCISERLIQETADAMLSHGFTTAGYNYVIIDDCWLDKGRDKQGRLQPDRERFPSGIAALADYTHARCWEHPACLAPPGQMLKPACNSVVLLQIARNLLFGIYGDIGEKTCGGWPGMQGHLKADAQTYADWGVDYLKVICLTSVLAVTSIPDSRLC